MATFLERIQRIQAEFKVEAEKYAIHLKNIKRSATVRLDKTKIEQRANELTGLKRLVQYLMQKNEYDKDILKVIRVLTKESEKNLDDISTACVKRLLSIAKEINDYVIEEKKQMTGEIESDKFEADLSEKNAIDESENDSLMVEDIDELENDSLVGEEMNESENDSFVAEEMDESENDSLVAEDIDESENNSLVGEDIDELENDSSMSEDIDESENDSLMADDMDELESVLSEVDDTDALEDALTEINELLEEENAQSKPDKLVLDSSRVDKLQKHLADKHNLSRPEKSSSGKLAVDPNFIKKIDPVIVVRKNKMDADEKRSLAIISKLDQLIVNYKKHISKEASASLRDIPDDPEGKAALKKMEKCDDIRRILTSRLDAAEKMRLARFAIEKNQAIFEEHRHRGGIGNRIMSVINRVMKYFGEKALGVTGKKVMRSAHQIFKQEDKAKEKEKHRMVHSSPNKPK